MSEYAAKYNKIPTSVLISLVMEMGFVIRELDQEGAWSEMYWTNDGNETGPAYNHALESASERTTR